MHANRGCAFFSPLTPPGCAVSSVFAAVASWHIRVPLVTEPEGRGRRRGLFLVWFGVCTTVAFILPAGLACVVGGDAFYPLCRHGGDSLEGGLSFGGGEVLTLSGQPSGVFTLSRERDVRVYWQK